MSPAGEPAGVPVPDGDQGLPAGAGQAGRCQGGCLGAATDLVGYKLWMAGGTWTHTSHAGTGGRIKTNKLL